MGTNNKMMWKFGIFGCRTIKPCLQPQFPITYFILSHRTSQNLNWKHFFVRRYNKYNIHLFTSSHSKWYESYTDILCLILSCPEFRQKVERQEVVTHTHYKTEDYWGLLLSSGRSGYENAMEKYVYGKLNKVLLHFLAIFLIYVMIFQSGACARCGNLKNHQICQK